jgi:hypothetical protein
MEKNDYSDTTFVWIKDDELSLEDFFSLSMVAAIENEKMKHKIFFHWKYNEDLRSIFTSLN